MQIKDLMKQHNLSPANAVSGGRRKSVKEHRVSVADHIQDSIKNMNKGVKAGLCATWRDGKWNIKIKMQSVNLLFDGKEALDFPDKTENKEKVIGVLKGLIEVIKSGDFDTALEAHMKAITAKRQSYGTTTAKK